jgi:hypothetical protein
MLLLVGSTYICVSAACGRTVTTVFPETAPNCAVSVTAVETEAVEAVPSPLGLIESKVGLLDVHATAALKSLVDSSEYVPVALNCCVELLATLAFAGVIAIEDRLAPVTVAEAIASTAPMLATTTNEPGARVVTTPPGVIVATLAGRRLQVTLVMTPAVLFA